MAKAIAYSIRAWQALVEEVACLSGYDALMQGISDLIIALLGASAGLAGLLLVVLDWYCPVATDILRQTQRLSPAMSGRGNLRWCRS